MKELKGTYQINSDKKIAWMKKYKNALKGRVLQSGLNDKEIKTNYRKKICV